MQVLELGAGCGLCGIAAAALCGARHVLLTDVPEHTLANLRHNVALNALDERANVAALDWNEPAAWPPPVQVLLGSDLIYAAEAVQPLLRCVCDLLVHGGDFFYVAPETNRLGEAQFLDGLRAAGFAREEHEVPPRYLANALPERPEEEFHMLFSELKERTYTLYRFYRAGCGAGGAAETAAAMETEATS